MNLKIIIWDFLKWKALIRNLEHLKLKLKMSTPTLVSCLRSPNGDGPRESAMWTAWVEISDVNSEISPSGLNSVFWRDLNCNVYYLASKLQDLLSVTQK